MDINPDKRRLLYVCDLNLSNGGAQKVTYNTLGCLASRYEIFIYSNFRPSDESINLAKELGIKIFLDFDFNLNKLADKIKEFKIEYILLQYENPKWVSSLCHLKRKLGVKTIILMYELPYIHTPINKFIHSWLVLTIINKGINFLSYARKYLKNYSTTSLEYVKVEEFSRHRSTIPKWSKFLQIITKSVIELRDTFKGIQQSDALIAMGPATKFYLKKYLKIRSSILEVDHIAAVDLPDGFKLDKKSYTYDICFMAARLEKGKGIFDLLKVLSKAQKNFDRKINLAIIGRFTLNEVENDFHNLLDRYQLRSNVSLLGFIPETEKVEVLNTSRIFVYPSRQDVFSISLAEALAYGCPAVVFELPFTEQYVSESVYRAPYKKLTIMSRDVVDLLNLSYDKPEVFKDLSGQSSIFIQNNFNWTKTCQELSNVLNLIL